LRGLRGPDRATLYALARTFEGHLRAENQVAQDGRTYLESVGQLSAFLGERGRTSPRRQRQDVEAFLADLLKRRSAASASVRYRVLRVFYDWLEDEGEIPGRPIRRLRPPAVPDKPVDVLTEEQLWRLPGTCAGEDFEGRRDTALVMLLDSGRRLAEIAEHVGDVDFDRDEAMVLGKGALREQDTTVDQ
jgi:site-specific recombinase XerD